MLTGSVDGDDLGHDESATATERASRGLGRLDRGDEAFFDRGPGYARLADGAPYAEVDRR